VSMLRLSLEFHFHLNSLSIGEWMLDSLKFYIVQYFLKNFSVLNWIRFKWTSTDQSTNQSTNVKLETMRRENNKAKVCVCVWMGKWKCLLVWDEWTELNVLCLPISDSEVLHDKFVFLLLFQMIDWSCRWSVCEFSINDCTFMKI
jgi:hypothetical protein